ncbi:hypothetical protein pb186bvf_002866 [Paramecium bursaria]
MIQKQIKFIQIDFFRQENLEKEQQEILYEYHLQSIITNPYYTVCDLVALVLLTNKLNDWIE